MRHAHLDIDLHRSEVLQTGRRTRTGPCHAALLSVDVSFPRTFFHTCIVADFDGAKEISSKSSLTESLGRYFFSHPVSADRSCASPRAHLLVTSSDRGLRADSPHVVSPVIPCHSSWTVHISDIGAKRALARLSGSRWGLLCTVGGGRKWSRHADESNWPPVSMEKSTS